MAAQVHGLLEVAVVLEVLVPRHPSELLEKVEVELLIR
jgi:hypothetical protein